MGEIVEKTHKVAKAKAAELAEADALADKANKIAGAATAKLNEAKKHAEDEASKAAIEQKKQEKIVQDANHEVTEIESLATQKKQEALAKQAAAQSMIKKIENAQCSKHAGCKGLTGYCCPTLNTNKMHLGSQKLDGESLGCCTSQELVAEVTAPTSGTFGAASMLLAAFTGSALTAVALKFFPGKASTN